MSSTSRALPDDGTPFIILGADAVLAALPASPVQLAHACQALGFHLAAPATWGDELIAEACLERLVDYEYPSAVMCSCPLVTERLTRASTTLEPFMLTFDSPPVATARYLRAAFGSQALHITYAGSCPGANHDSIDARLRPSDLLDAFVESGIVLGAQPNCFDALVPLDRRRFYSLPGGVPARDHVERLANRASIELGGDDVVLELTQHLIEESPALLDIALHLGCVCAGVGEHAQRGNPRAGLLTIEPPRARRPVLDPSLQVDVTQTLAQLCENRAAAPEEPAPLEVHLAADVPPVLANVEERGVVEVADVSAAVLVDVEESDIVEVAEESAAAATSRRRPLVGRAHASIPRHVNASGEMVPRASLAALRRALAHNARREARLHAAKERGRRERAVEMHEDLEHGVARTPFSHAIASGADLPRPVPPPPTRYRPRTMQGF
ncbi:MAG TPA: hypothetical protein VK617_03805 [Gemmatimonadaceae bacterium]|nr:hypothetical protein [Gemmatimonadaceae bacterium]